MPRRATRTKARKRKEHRRADRVSAALPVDLDGANGPTRDVSASGAFFETDASYSVGSEVRVAIDLETPRGPARFDCRGEIVRLERHDGTVGVAVRFTDSDTHAAPPPAQRRRR